MHSTSSAVQIEKIINIAKTAGKYAREQIYTDHDIGIKGAQDIVTEVDRKNEAFILESLRALYPSHAILTEESGAHQGDTSRCWYIDPLDGTMNYAHGIPFYCVSIGFAVDGEPVLGVVYDPNLDECFYAEKGKGAFLNGKPIRVSEISDRTMALLDTGFSAKMTEMGRQNFDLFRHFMMTTAGVRRLGSAALGMCYVACGRMNGMWEICLSPWDIAAGIVILNEAGAKTTRFDGGENAFTDPWCFLTANPALHGQLLNDLRTISSEYVAPKKNADESGSI